MPSEGLASPALAEFAPHERQGRGEPELGPSTVPWTAYPTVPFDSPAAAGLSGVVSEFDTEPRLFDFVRRQAQLTSAPSRSAPAERPHVGTVFYFLLVGLIAAAIIGVFFGVAFSLLTLPKDHTVVGAGSVSPGVEGAVSTAKDTTRAGNMSASIVASVETAPAPNPSSVSPEPLAPPPRVSPSPVAAELVGPPGESTHPASGAGRSVAHSAGRRGRSAYHHRQPSRGELAAQTDKQRILSAAMDRAHHENFSDP